MKILVTGGAGYIGSHMIYKLLGYVYTPVILDNFSTGSKKNFQAILKFIMLILDQAQELIILLDLKKY